ncbi:MAG: hypothetical protein ACRC3I_11155 [Cetobacterium sp.]
MNRNSVHTSEEYFISKLIIPFLVERKLIHKILEEKSTHLIELAIDEFSKLDSKSKKNLASKIYKILETKYS